MVDTSDLGTAVLSQDTVLCLILESEQICYQGYLLGNAEEQVFAKVGRSRARVFLRGRHSLMCD